MKEPFLEPLLRQMRIRRVSTLTQHYPDCALLDIGCGWEARLLKAIEPFIGRGEGIASRRHICGQRAIHPTG